MADDFSFLTDSDDERAVEDVLSQAMDHSVLEQIAAINCSSFSNSDNLPSHLETRFRKLKSLPATVNSAAVPRFPPAKSKSFRPQSGDEFNRNSVDFDQITDPRKFSQKSPIDSPDDEYIDGKKATKSNRKPKSSPNTDPRTFSRKSSSIDSPEEHSDQYRDEKNATKPKSSANTDPRELSRKSSPIGSPEEHSDEKKATKPKQKPKPKSKSKLSSDSDSMEDLKSKSKPGTGSPSPFDSWSESLSPESDSGTLSPPPRRSIGCLWCSPKKEKSVSVKKQGKENRLWSSSSLGSDYDSEFLKSFSIKEQKKIMKKAMKEEEKINREAEKIVKWAKQASSRMMEVNVITGLDDHLSDLEK